LCDHPTHWSWYEVTNHRWVYIYRFHCEKRVFDKCILIQFHQCYCLQPDCEFLASMQEHIERLSYCDSKEAARQNNWTSNAIYANHAPLLNIWSIAMLYHFEQLQWVLSDVCFLGSRWVDLDSKENISSSTPTVQRYSACFNFVVNNDIMK